MGSKRPLLVNTVSHETFKMSNQVSLLAALEASYYVNKTCFINLSLINRCN